VSDKLVPYSEWGAELRKLAKDVYHFDLEEDPCGWRAWYEDGATPAKALEENLFGQPHSPHLPDFEPLSTTYSQSLAGYMQRAMLDEDYGRIWDEDEEDDTTISEMLNKIDGVFNADFEVMFSAPMTYSIEEQYDNRETHEEIQKTILDYIRKGLERQQREEK